MHSLLSSNVLILGGVGHTLNGSVVYGGLGLTGDVLGGGEEGEAGQNDQQGQGQSGDSLEVFHGR